MATISTDGITAGSTISATHITNIISALSGTSAATVVATGSFSGSLTGVASTATLATKASTLASGGGNGAAMTFTANGLGGQPFYLWGTGDGTNMYLYTTSVFNVASATSASYVANAASATTAATAASVDYYGITNLPAGISAVGGVSLVDTSLSGSGGVSVYSASLLTSGRFYSVSAATNKIVILLDNIGAGTGTEFTFFGKNVDYSINFVSSSNADTIISENGYLSVYGTGSAVTAKLISESPVIWALIGSLKA